MNKGQHRLKAAFERTRVLHRYQSGEDVYMIDHGVTKLNDDTLNSGEQNEVISKRLYAYSNVKLLC